MNTVAASVLVIILGTPLAAGQPRHRSADAPPPPRRTHTPPAPGRLEAALRTAAGERNLEMVRRLLDQGADPKVAEAAGETALLAAVRGRGGPGDEDVTPLLTLLLDKGADINAQDSAGISPLTAAIDRHDPGVVTFLIDHGAELGVLDAQGRTPLMHAATTRMGADVGAALAIIDRLLALHADPAARDHDGRTPLHYAVAQHITEAGGTLSHSQVVDALLGGGADVNARADDGATPLLTSIAVWRGPLEVVRTLLEHGADVNSRDAAGASPLVVAARMGKVEEVRLLLTFHADPNDRRGEAPLTYAIEAGYANVVNALIEGGASLEGTGYATVERALAATRDFALMSAADRGDSEKVGDLLRDGASVAARDRHGRTALHTTAASYAPMDAVVHLLIEAGADVSAVDDQGDTALILAAARHSV